MKRGFVLIVDTIMVDDYEKIRLLSSKIPLALALILIVISGGYWIYSANRSQNQLHEQTEHMGDDLSNNIGERIYQQINLVNTLLLDQWVSTDNKTELFDYNRYLQIIPNFYNFIEGYLAINWINTTGTIKWIYPYEENLGALNKSIVRFVNGELNTAFSYSSSTGKLGISSLIPFYQGGTGLATYIPIIYEDEIIGYFNAVFNIETLIDIYLETHQIKIFSFYIYENDSMVYHHNEDFKSSDNYVHKNNITFYNRQWQLLVRPNGEEIFSVSPLANIILLVVGLIASIIAFAFSRFILKQNIIMENHYKEKESYEKMMWQYQKMDALGTLAGGMAHDFNNLLMGIQGNVSVLSDFIFEEIKENKNVDDNLKLEMGDALVLIEKILKRSKNLTKQILAFSHHSDTLFEIIDIQHSIRNVVQIINQTADKRISITLDIQSKDNVIFGNQNKLSQIFMNIIINAIDALENGGNIEITITKAKSPVKSKSIQKLKEIDSSLEYDPHSRIKITISDNGIGIKEEHLESVFDPFFTTKTIGKGTGLGLPIAYQSVKSLYGDIGISSTIGVGTTVSVFFSQVIRREETIIDSETISYFSNDKSITSPQMDPNINEVLFQKNCLIIEDEESIRKSLKGYLNKAGAEITVFADGINGLQHYQTNPKMYDLVILDINLPGINGIELYHKMIQLNKEQKVIFITGYSEAGIPMASDENVIILEKPFNSKSLFDTLKNIFSK